MRIVKTAIIMADPETVFGVVTDFSSYPLWNPWIVKAEGECKQAVNVVVDVILRGKPRQFNHKIVQVKKPELFHWCDVGWFTLFVDGERIRTFMAHELGTEYRVELNITGPLAFFAKWLFASSLESGMTNETAALKQWVEEKARHR